MHSRTIGFPRETGAAERRTLLTPHVARLLTGDGHRVVAESGIGDGIGLDDGDLAAAGVKFADTATIWSAPLVLRYKSGPPHDMDRLDPEQTVAAIFHAEGHPDMLDTLTRSGITAYSYEFLRENGRFPLAAAGGQIAGTLAVHAGAQALRHPRGRGVLIDAVAGAPRARVVVIGNGNVGHAATSTAVALGAHVTVLTRDAASATAYRRKAPAGTVVAPNTPDRLHEALTDADLVIGAILISTYTTAPMITRDHLSTMRPGAVIVDATCGYGPGYLPTAGPVQEPGQEPHVVDGILHVKYDALPRMVPHTASYAYAHAATPYLLRLARHVLDQRADDDVATARIARRGELTHPVVRDHAALYLTGQIA
ncbi:alanine dehydrogenase [Myceligenerans halotolerans]